MTLFPARGEASREPFARTGQPSGKRPKVCLQRTGDTKSFIKLRTMA